MSFNISSVIKMPFSRREKILYCCSTLPLGLLLIYWELYKKVSINNSVVMSLELVFYSIATFQFFIFFKNR